MMLMILDILPDNISGDLIPYCTNKIPIFPEQARDSQIIIHHLITEMSTLDQSQGDHVVPRFIGYADNRDFFYLLRKRMEAISAI